MSHPWLINSSNDDQVQILLIFHIWVTNFVRSIESSSRIITLILWEYRQRRNWLIIMTFCFFDIDESSFTIMHFDDSLTTATTMANRSFVFRSYFQNVIVKVINLNIKVAKSSPLNRNWYGMWVSILLTIGIDWTCVWLSWLEDNIKF
jgi:hypothetical protein